jgi:Ca-activated chloride channel family protein
VKRFSAAWLLLTPTLVVAVVLGSVASARPQDGAEIVRFGESLKKTSDKKHKRPPEIPSQPSDSDDAIKIQTVLTVTDVYVKDEKGGFVGGLKKDDFQITEDGTPQQIEVFSNGDDRPIPRSIVMIIDHSGSQLAYLKNSIEAAKILISKLPADDRMAIVTDDVRLLQDFTNDKDVLIKKLEELKDRTFGGEVGKSLQYSSLYAVLQEKFQGSELRPVIIFQTDGDELTTLKGAGYKFSLANFSYEDVARLAVSSGAAIYTINPGTSFVGIDRNEARKRALADLKLGASAYDEVRRRKPARSGREYTDQFLDQWASARAKDETAICQLAESTGGWAVNIPTPDKASEAYAKIFDEMSRRYTLGYYPTNQSRDGSLRSISVSVAGGKYTIRHKASYLASTAPAVQP